MLEPGNDRRGGLPVGTHIHHPFAIRSQGLDQRPVQTLAAQGPAPHHDRSIALVGHSIAQLRVQAQQGRPSFGDQQHARGPAVESVHQFKETSLGTRGPQPLDDTVRNPTPPMNGNPSGLVDRQQRLILPQDR